MATSILSLRTRWQNAPEDQLQKRRIYFTITQRKRKSSLGRDFLQWMSRRKLRNSRGFRGRRCILRWNQWERGRSNAEKYGCHLILLTCNVPKLHLLFDFTQLEMHEFCSTDKQWRSWRFRFSVMHQFSDMNVTYYDYIRKVHVLLPRSHKLL